MRECPACGFSNSSDSNYCAQCGARLPVHTGDTTSLIQVVDDELLAGDVDAYDAAAQLAPGTALLIVTRGFDGGASYLLDKPAITVGRSNGRDILLDDITVSRHHATFDLADGVVTITDHGSLNGTYVNRELIEGSQTLKRGDEVQIGKFRMVLLVNERGS
ncbi:MAG: FHA domain-containing protein [Propionibacteriaceae bacterium]|nr:FHA domain-containing protein [Propionibacteriaceae bacterium]